MYIKTLSKLLMALLLAVSALCSANSETTRTLSLESVRAKYASPESQFVDLDGVNVHYRDEGRGPAILLVHGTLGDTDDWNQWAEILAENYRVIRFDLPGFGLSGPMANGNYSIDRMLGVIDALMDHVGEEAFAIAGISYGGIITFRYAATRRDRVTAMVLLNSAGIQAGKRAAPKKQQTTQKAPLKNIFADPIVAYADVEAFYSVYINDPKARTPAFIQRKLDTLNIVGRDEVGKRGQALYERGNPQRVLGKVKAPSLVIWGQGNKALGNATAEAFIAALKRSRHTELVWFKQGGHYINVERPLETAAAAKRFLDKDLIKPKDHDRPASP